MYDYLAKIILLGPSGSGKSCLLHRFTHHSFRALTSQTIGVEFASKIIRVGEPPSSSPSPYSTHHRSQRIKLQLWDTAGTERFRSVSRSYYRGAAGAILVYDVSERKSFDALPTFLHDARSLAGEGLVAVLAGNKVDVCEPDSHPLPTSPEPGGTGGGAEFGTSISSTYSTATANGTPKPAGLGARQSLTVAPAGRAVPFAQASGWASGSGVPVAVEVSAYTGAGVDDLFTRLASMILTKIELGEIDPDDPASGIQYGDSGGWGDGGDGGSVRSGKGGGGGGGKGGGWFGLGGGLRRRGRGRPGTREREGLVGLREWEEVFGVQGGRRRGGGCC